MNQNLTERIDQIDALLPQTHCGQCGYPGCRPYAEAIAIGVAPINQCPPGGQGGVASLAEYLGVDELVLKLEQGDEAVPKRVVIVEQDCIGCTRCLPVCPVDAIIGSSKHMHTVISHECTGCGLCVPVCPVDCIEIHTTDYRFDPELSRQRFQRKQARQVAIELARQVRMEKQKQLLAKIKKSHSVG